MRMLIRAIRHGRTLWLILAWSLPFACCVRPIYIAVSYTCGGINILMIVEIFERVIVKVLFHRCWLSKLANRYIHTYIGKGILQLFFICNLCSEGPSKYSGDNARMRCGAAGYSGIFGRREMETSVSCQRRDPPCREAPTEIISPLIRSAGIDARSFAWSAVPVFSAEQTEFLKCAIISSGRLVQ